MSRILLITRTWAIALLAWTAILPIGCDNNPYPQEDPASKTFFFSFPSPNRHLDPVKSYSSGEYRFLTAILEPPFQFHYLKRPVEVVPRTTVALPTIRRFDASGNLLDETAPSAIVKKVVYTVRLKPNILYQDHPCFEKKADGSYRWHLGPDGVFPDVDHPHKMLGASDSKRTRPLRAADYVYQIKRMAHPMLDCPVLKVFEPRIVGMKQFKGKIADRIKQIRAERKAAAGADYNRERDERLRPIHVDLRKFDLPGVQATDPLTLTITTHGDFPQLVYWLTMPFFSPVPWEACRFYNQPAAVANNFSLDRHPVGTGPFVMSENRPNYRIILERNPNFHEAFYPTEGAPGDREAGLLEAAGQKLPFLDRAVFMLDREAPPRWSKFLQGYYDLVELEPVDDDLSGQAIEVSQLGISEVSPELSEKGIQMHIGQRPFIRYWAFNMKDETFGGLSDRARKLRQAISIAIDINQYIQIFRHGRGRIAHGPVPVGIPGHRRGRTGINPVVYRWNEQANKPVPRPIEDAQQLMVEAGYPGGKGPDGQPLELNYDVVADRSNKEASDWINSQLEPLGIKVNLRATDSNQWRKKLADGNYQFMSYGWYADYPDAENFLFLLYGPNGKADFNGENYANYQNDEYDRLFEQMATMPDSPKRREIIDRMVQIARTDAPWLFAWQPDSYALHQPWLKNYKPRFVSAETLKYIDVDAQMRSHLLPKWNRPITWPLWAGAGFLALAAVPAVRMLIRRRRGEAAA
ncbi:MAG: ABC transporter substrate-binding protein [Phycisphaeraceae bacterium]|nr:ABC transporter substrate-binding protein [Phycisphaeraceae bacterium]